MFWAKICTKAILGRDEIWHELCLLVNHHNTAENLCLISLHNLINIFVIVVDTDAKEMCQPVKWKYYTQTGDTGQQATALCFPQCTPNSGGIMDGKILTTAVVVCIIYKFVYKVSSASGIFYRQTVNKIHGFGVTRLTYVYILW